MSKIKILLITVIAAIFIGAIASANYYYNKYTDEKTNRERLEENQNQYLQQDSKYVRLEQKLEEFINTMTPKVDSILMAEKIKPRNVTNVIERHFVYRDTSYNSYTPEPIKTIDGIVFPFIDIKDCIRVDGYVKVDDLRPTVTITNREFQNSSIDIGYIKREKKFWFINYGKWRAKLKTVNQCGETTTKEIKVIKE